MHDEEAPTIGPARRSVQVGWSVGGETIAPTRAREGAQIGPYKLLSKLGEGGFGVVWLAEQSGTLRRRVALKVIKPGMDTSQVVARFEAERQALAVMDHPSIAKVFDGGLTSDGRPYFVMELVEGKPITGFCDTERCGLRERIRLMVKVCDAIQHAHNKGVIHRDLKPNNILVTYADGRPTPKVIDFGVAKALNQRLTERTIYTEQGQLIGTPAYMSPEQAEGTGLDVDTRSDVYSLGVILYELLTGQIPYDPDQLRTASFAEIQRIVCEVDPPTPSQRYTHGTSGWTYLRSAGRGVDPKATAKILRQDLDWVVMKCLAKNREARYSSPGTLGEELTRFLDGFPVSARRSNFVYTAVKGARRHKAAIAGGVVALALMLGAIGSAVFALSGRSLGTQVTELQAEGAGDAAMLRSRLAEHMAAEVGLSVMALMGGNDAALLGARAASGSAQEARAIATLAGATAAALGGDAVRASAGAGEAEGLIRRAWAETQDLGAVAWPLYRLGVHRAMAGVPEALAAGGPWNDGVWRESGRLMTSAAYEQDRAALVAGLGVSAAAEGPTAVGRFDRADAAELARRIAAAAADGTSGLDAARAHLRLAVLRHAAGQMELSRESATRARSAARGAGDGAEALLLAYTAEHLLAWLDGRVSPDSASPADEGLDGAMRAAMDTLTR